MLPVLTLRIKINKGLFLTTYQTDDSENNSSCCSSRGLEVNYQHLPQVAHKPCNSSSKGFKSIFGLLGHFTNDTHDLKLSIKRLQTSRDQIKQISFSPDSPQTFYVGKDDLELHMSLPQLPKCWDYRITVHVVIDPRALCTVHNISTN